MSIDSELANKGMTPADAGREALRSFGRPEKDQGTIRAAEGLPMIETTLQDLRSSASAAPPQPGVFPSGNPLLL